MDYSNTTTPTSVLAKITKEMVFDPKTQDPISKLLIQFWIHHILTMCDLDDLAILRRVSNGFNALICAYCEEFDLTLGLERVRTYHFGLFSYNLKDDQAIAMLKVAKINGTDLSIVREGNYGEFNEISLIKSDVIIYFWHLDNIHCIPFEAFDWTEMNEGFWCVFNCAICKEEIKAGCDYTDYPSFHDFKTKVIAHYCSH